MAAFNTEKVICEMTKKVSIVSEVYENPFKDNTQKNYFA